MTIIIAEAGVNHNGDMTIARRLVEEAHRAGADYVKFQTFKSTAIATDYAAKANYQIVSTGGGQSQREMIEQLELSKANHDELIDVCNSVGIKFLSTAFDIESLEFLLQKKCLDYIKIPSGELTNLPLLRKIALADLPIIMSTGMATYEEIGDSLEVLEKAGVPKEKISILHCTTEYPAPLTDVNLVAMDKIRDLFNCDVGYSDHTLGIEVSLAAVARGASIVEKHFTLDRSLAGPDHAASLEPKELKGMIDAIRNVELAIGEASSKPTRAEVQNRAVARKSIVASCPIAKGTPFSDNNITTKRPGTGLSPMRWDEVIGKRAARDFQSDELIEL